MLHAVFIIHLDVCITRRAIISAHELTLAFGDVHSLEAHYRPLQSEKLRPLYSEGHDITSTRLMDIS